jgi:hypothetical protein
LPHAREDGVGVLRIDPHLRRPRAIVGKQHALEGLTVIERAVQPTFFLGTVRVAGDRHENSVRIFDVNRNLSDLLPVAKSSRCVHVLPASVDL